MWLFRKKTEEGAQPGLQEDLHCSFCSKSQAEVAKLIAGPKVYICDECVSLCDDILAEESAKAEVRPPGARPVVPTGLFCSLCRFPVEAGGFVMIPDRGPLCPTYLDAIRAVTEDDDSRSETQ